MKNFRFITIRLGKDSVEDIKKLCAAQVGIQDTPFTINVKCTQIPDNYSNGDYAFIWLGSDNNKGMATEWKQGFKAIGLVQNVVRGEKYNDTSETTLQIIYIFKESINRMDILRCAPTAFYWCSSMPLIGIDDHANQTIRSMSGTSFADMGAFFCVLQRVANYFKSDILKLQPGFAPFFKRNIPSPTRFSNVKSLETISQMDYFQNSSVVGNPFISALHTKPFLLLAGISGTGKSQKVQELAFMSCPEELRNEEGTTPKNYCLIEVKPNWHDSSELLGYYSALTGKYELTDFIRFAYRAVKFPQYPFFLCLDEMNLAPVEQYFAEFLSVLETRKTVDGIILSQPLLKKEKFANCELEREIEHFHEGFVTDGQQTQKKPIYSQEDSEIIKYLKENGLPLPSNLFVIGTVNMDDTTHQFSRKVIDRAFTIEMNGGKMAEMFSQESRNLLEYREAPVHLSVFQSEFVRAYEVLEDSRFSQYEDIIVKRIPEILGDPDGDVSKDSINGILHTTPFRVSYRVQNELVLYLSVLIEQADYPDDIEPLIKEATLAILMEKILPRVQGEKKQLETANGSDVLKDMKTFVETHFAPEEGHDSTMFNKVIKKLDEMEKKLDSYYTNFF